MVGNVRTMEIDDQPQQMSDVQESTMYRNRKHVQKRPIGITLLGISMLAGGMFCICAGFSESPAGILGMAVSGTPAVVIHFLHAGISFYIFTGFLKLRKNAWTVYMIFFAFGITNNLITMMSSISVNQLATVMLMCLFGYYVYGKKELFVN
ncbi:MAG: hypothetical protein U9R02_07725 [Thermodesulfobacteriota bacterium]|nr:hypothetical protein [Thermodesulfobacteriota bacterium]